eukprot:54841_1
MGNININDLVHEDMDEKKTSSITEEKVRQIYSWMSIGTQQRRQYFKYSKISWKKMKTKRKYIDEDKSLETLVKIKNNLKCNSKTLRHDALVYFNGYITKLNSVQQFKIDFQNVNDMFNCGYTTVSYICDVCLGPHRIQFKVNK